MEKQKVGDAVLHAHPLKLFQVADQADALIGDVRHNDARQQHVIQKGDESDMKIIFRPRSLGLAAAPGGATEFGE